MDERLALTPAEENQKGLKAEFYIFHVYVWIMFLSSNSFEASKTSPLVTQYIRFHQAERFPSFFHRVG